MHTLDYRGQPISLLGGNTENEIAMVQDKIWLVEACTGGRRIGEPVDLFLSPVETDGR